MANATHYASRVDIRKTSGVPITNPADVIAETAAQTAYDAAVATLKTKAASDPVIQAIVVILGP